MLYSIRKYYLVRNWLYSLRLQPLYNTRDNGFKIDYKNLNTWVPNHVNYMMRFCLVPNIKIMNISKKRHTCAYHCNNGFTSVCKDE